MESTNNEYKNYKIQKQAKFVPPLKPKLDKEIFRNYNFTQKPTVEVVNTISLDGFILKSSNILNDDDTQQTPSLDITQEMYQNISQNESKVPVVTLNKTYKNMDMTSNENLQINDALSLIESYINEDNSLNNKISEVEQLFNNNKIINFDKMPAMSIQYGDIGLYHNYIDYVKQNAYLYQNNNVNNVLDVLKIYPNENIFS